MTRELEVFFAAQRAQLEQFLASTLDDYSQSVSHCLRAQSLLDAMRYSTLAGGKRIRAMLVYIAADTCRKEPDTELTDVAAAAVELVHCYSLIHDDLPAMDDDDLRRGKPTCHLQFGEATAILAGDALQTLAFDLLSSAGNGSAALRLSLIAELTRASGMSGMVGGQAIDLASVNQPMDYDELCTMHRLKTGALIEAAVTMGSLCGHAGEAQSNTLREYARRIGLAFQIQDDILDIEGETAQIGKPQGADLAANKPTFPALLGLQNAKTRAAELCDEAIALLDDFGPRAELMRALARFVIDRPS